VEEDIKQELVHVITLPLQMVGMHVQVLLIKTKTVIIRRVQSTAVGVYGVHSVCVRVHVVKE
jgi:hypothetical protein